MTDAPSQHEDWFQSDDALSADRPIEPPAPSQGPGIGGGPTLSPPSTELSTGGLRSLIGSVTPSLSMPAGPTFGAEAVELDGPVVAAPTALDRALAAASAVPIERIAPLTAVAFVCSLLTWGIVRALF